MSGQPDVKAGGQRSETALAENQNAQKSQLRIWTKIISVWTALKISNRLIIMSESFTVHE